MKANLCTCNNCDGIFIDRNAQTNAPEFNVFNGEYPDLEYMTDSGGGFWVCPVCHTDDYLDDDVPTIESNP